MGFRTVIRCLCLAATLVLATGCAGKQSVRDDAKPPSPETALTRYPIVLAHGFLAGGRVAPFVDVAETLRAEGQTVFETRVLPIASVEERAQLLAEQVDAVLEVTGAEKVNVIAHSMGGLDARYLVSSLGYDDRVASVTTLSTPHRGAEMADRAARIAGPTLTGWMTDIITTFDSHLLDLPRKGNMQAALGSLSVARIEAFNRENPDQPGVYYQSFAGVTEPEAEDVEAVCGTVWRPSEGAPIPPPQPTAELLEESDLDDEVVTVASAF